jgi:hypothetical protein
MKEKEKMPNKIPKGMYCYDANGVCPYWGLDTNRPTHENGFCTFIPMNDWDCNIGIPLLWDQVKECGINDDVEWYEEPEGAL